MSLTEPVQTPFGYSFAPLDLTSARLHTSSLVRTHAGEGDALTQLLQPHYSSSAGSYRPSATTWQRSIHLLPAASPRSFYSRPLGGGDPQPELAPGTYEKLAKDAKESLKVQFYRDRNEPRPGPFRVGVDDDGVAASSTRSPPPTLVAQRLVPFRRAGAKGTVLVAVHGLGFCKENFLPLLDRLVAEPDYGIDQIWLVDGLGHGATSTYNRDRHGVTTSDDLLSSSHRYVDPNDYARDLLQFLTCYLPSALDVDVPATVLPYAPPRLPRTKLVGLGHSFGATSLLQLSVHLSELFSDLCVVEPILIPQQLQDQAGRIPLSRLTLMKQDRWSSRAEAREDVARDRVTSSWDARVIDTFVAGGLSSEGDDVQRSCDRVAESLCIRSNCGIQLATHTLKHISPHVKVVYVSAHKPMVIPLQEVSSIAHSCIRNLVFVQLSGGHTLVQEKPDDVADLLKRMSIRLEKGRSRL